jgi:DnaJ domain
MKYEDACNIFELDPLADYDEISVKRQYKKLSLKRHPDKNTSPDACYEFQQLHEAYMVLLQDVDDKEGDYLDSDDDIEIGKPNIPLMVQSILQYIIQLYNTNVMNMLEYVDKDTLLNVYCFLCKHRKRFPQVADSLIQHIGNLLKAALKRKMSNDRIYIIYPKLEDLLDCNVYKHIEGEKTLLVPCWLEECVFDSNDPETGGEIVFNCIPVCPQDTWIDDNRNIHKVITYGINEIWDIPESEDIKIEIGTNIFSPVKRRELMLKKEQTVMLTNMGIPVGNNTKDLFDVSIRGHIFFHIRII